MLYAAIIIFVIAAFLLIRLFAVKKEVQKIIRQLQNYNNRKTNKKIDMVLFDQDIENLGSEINKLIDLYVAEHRQRIRYENEQKQAIANMSHDLRTPLTSILGYIQMAEGDGVTTDERKELLTIANERAKRFETLLNDFFELSVIESTDHHLKSEHVNLRNLTIDVLMSFYDRFHEKNREPAIHLPENDVFIIADQSAVTRVIENLLANAISYSDGNINISLAEQDSRVKLIVKNDAHSLRDEDARRMFDRFYRADQSRSGKNAGLGLSIVKSLMGKMNGKITGQLNEGQLSIICEWKAVDS